MQLLHALSYYCPSNISNSEFSHENGDVPYSYGSLPEEGKSCLYMQSPRVCQLKFLLAAEDITKHGSIIRPKKTFEKHIKNEDSVGKTDVRTGNMCLGSCYMMIMMQKHAKSIESCPGQLKKSCLSQKFVAARHGSTLAPR